MGKSLGNFITLEQLFTGNHPKLTQAYAPMTVRFFILQAHYRGTLDFSNEALQAAEKGLQRLMQAWKEISPFASLSRNDKMPGASPVISSAVEKSPVVEAIREKIEDALCDDLNTPIAIAHLFDAVKLINSGALTPADKAAMKQLFDDILGTVMGLSIDEEGGSEKWEKALDGAMEIVLESRKKAREEKNWAESDRIRDRLAAAGITVKDTKDGATWTLQ